MINQSSTLKAVYVPFSTRLLSGFGALIAGVDHGSHDVTVARIDAAEKKVGIGVGEVRR